MQEIQQPESSPPFSKWKIGLAIALSLGISAYLLIANFKLDSLKAIEFSRHLIVGLLFALIALIIRDATFVYKIRLSSGNRITWLKALEAVIMWEFCAAVTPKLTEAAFILYVLKKAGLSYGRSTAVVLLNSFLDNLVFLIVFGILYAVLGNQMLHLPYCEMLQGNSVIVKAAREAHDQSDKIWIGIVVMSALCAFLAVGLFIIPGRMKATFYRLAEFKWLRRLKETLLHLGDEIETTATEYKNQSIGFWIKMGIATFINWTSRYLLSCALLWIVATGVFPLLEVYARQYMHWVFMIIPATPGSSGIAEAAFIGLNCTFMPQDFKLAIAITTIWRIYSYYAYIVIGAIIFPRWVNKAVTEPEPEHQSPVS